MKTRTASRFPLVSPERRRTSDWTYWMNLRDGSCMFGYFSSRMHDGFSRLPNFPGWKQSLLRRQENKDRTLSYRLAGLQAPAVERPLLVQGSFKPVWKKQ